MFVCGACGQRYEEGRHCPSDGEPLVETTDPLLGSEIGRYRIAQMLGEGGMGQVYLGVQPMIGSRVAIKILSAECARNPELIERFFAEARAVNLIRHESIVSVIDMAQLADGRPYIVMEFVEGPTLAAVVRGGTAPIGGVVQVMTEVLSAIGAAHALGIVHRDLKPDNVIVTAGGHAKVLDFGIAKLAPGLSNAVSPRTRTGALLGTPAYMSPEQISASGKIDARTDLYAAGIVLFEAVTGRVPFASDALYDLMHAHLSEPPPSPRARRPDLPAAFEAVILKALAKDPARRFQSANEMAQAMHEAARELPPDQWRTLSRSATNQPSVDSMRPLTPLGPGHATTVRGFKPTSPPSRSRRFSRIVVIAALATVAGGIALIVATQEEDGAREPAILSTSTGAGAGIPVPPIGAPVAAASGPSPPPVAAGASTAPTSPVPPPATSPPTSPPTSVPGTASPPQRAPAASAGRPTIVGGGSAADHGVHIGSGVTFGSNVVIGSAPAPIQPKSFTRPIDYNPKKFDGAGYATKALALARSIYPDAGFVRFDTHHVYPNGLADLGLTDRDSSYMFRSPSHSARPTGVPKNVEVEITCYVEVTVGTRHIAVRPRSNSSDADCKAPLRALPSCSLAQVWAKAKASGVDLDTVATISFLDDGKWFFDNERDGVGLTESYPDRCP